LLLSGLPSSENITLINQPCKR